jgi:hypothetical protein
MNADKNGSLRFQFRFPARIGARVFVIQRHTSRVLSRWREGVLLTTKAPHFAGEDETGDRTGAIRLYLRSSAAAFSFSS